MAILTLAGLVTTGLAWLIADAHTPGHGIAAALGGGLVWLTSALALFPVARMAPRGPMQAAQSFMLSLTIRLLLTLATGLVGALGFGLPPRPFLLALASVYLVLLAAEAGLITRYLNRAYPAPQAA